jgi:hypothetical protein
VCSNIKIVDECISTLDCDYFFSTGCGRKIEAEDCEILGKRICSKSSKCIWDSTDTSNENCRKKECSDISGTASNHDDCVESNVEEGCDWYIVEGCEKKSETDNCEDLGISGCNVNDCNWDDEDGCSNAKYCEDIYEKANCKSFSESLDGKPCYIDTDELCKGAISCSNLTYDKSNSNICIQNKNNENLGEYCFWDVDECKTVKICSDLTYDGTDGTLCENNTEEDGIEESCLWDESNSVNKICRVKVCKDILDEKECKLYRTTSSGCFWDNTGSSGICKTKSSDQYYNANHCSP